MKVDKGSLPLRKTISAEELNQKLKDVGQMYEKQFLRELVKAMRTTVPESDFMKKTQAEQIFQEQLDHQLVEHWGDRGGIGLGDMISKQLVEKYGKNTGGK